ncbi:hypothetical protein SDC9_120818 [bioreactor metagenome]|uniref:Phosphodiester glycosidase domain-containing protein n=1 Tax=bioreactor metagenome TaxID=1076179 RepID=A0A645CA80_9ZZZZ|nr:phosphodiester glycosidase family protein [Oscillospiraceae bacterium]
MKKFFEKPYRWALTFSAILAACMTFVLLDTFVIPRVIAVITATGTGNHGHFFWQTSEESDINSDNTTVMDSDTDLTPVTGTEANTGTYTQGQPVTEEPLQQYPVIKDNYYKDENIEININEIRRDSTQVYIADIKVSSLKYLKTAFAKNSYGRNLKEKTSAMAKSNNAIFAINGDYYAFRNTGFVLRNGFLYRSTAGTGDALAIFADGTFKSIKESTANIDSLVSAGAYQILSFGPTLINNSEIVVSKNAEVGRAMSSNPRTAIGIISPLHYVFVVSDGRTDKSAGLSLYQLADVFADLNCTCAYNLDGGGSATMWFNGEVVNIPTDGNGFYERNISDILYIGK